jgi:hypothetical protein
MDEVGFVCRENLTVLAHRRILKKQTKNSARTIATPSLQNFFNHSVPTNC